MALPRRDAGPDSTDVAETTPVKETLMRMLRNLARRRLRTGLTITGIAIGIWALVMFSSMANKINTMVAGDSRYHADKIVVSADALALGDAPMRLDLRDQIAAVDGVDVVAPAIAVLSGDLVGIRIGPPT